MMDLLKQLYFIQSKSFNEQNMSRFVQSQLNKMHISFMTDEDMQIYSIKPNTPLLCAHMDQVGHEQVTQLINTGYMITGDKNIGADDKNGIWIILNLLQRHPNLSFIFSTQEEVGGNLHTILYEHKDILTTMPYALIFDRKGLGDIIGTENAYCNDDLEDEAATIGQRFNYKPAQGVWSDCDAISNRVPCMNLSCGYYNAHANDEYTIIPELYNALEFGNALLHELPNKRHKLPQKYEPIFGTRYNTRYSTRYSNRYNTRYTKQYYTNRNQSQNTYDTYDAYEEIFFYCPVCDEYFYCYELNDTTYCPRCYGELFIDDDDYYDSYDNSYEASCNQYDQYTRKENYHDLDT